MKYLYSPDDVTHVRNSADLAAVAAQHVALNRHGQHLKGLCPFHDERTASFYVYPDNRWFCFGCQEHGDVIDFTQKIEGEGFRWAIEHLAAQFNVTLSAQASESDREAQSERDRLIGAHELATRLFADQLRDSPDADRARAILSERGYDIDHAIDNFGCGYAPNNPNLLVADLHKNGYTDDELIRSGLALRPKNGNNQNLRSRFHGRLTWSIRNSFGRPIGFGARRVHDNDPITAKFINTAETPIYKKSSVLYGLDLARRTIAANCQVHVVEGYTDTMASHLAGITNTVATCGTALTREHLHTLRRLIGESGELVIAMDDDKAGRKAAIAVYDLAHTAVPRLSTLPPSASTDPDDVFRTQGPEALTAHMAARRPLIENVIQATLAGLATKTPEDRAVALNAIVPILNHISDPLIRSDYGRQVANTLDFDPHQVNKRIRITTPTTDTPSPAQSTAPTSSDRSMVHLLVHDESLTANLLDAVEPLLTADAAHAVTNTLRTVIRDRDESTPWPVRLLHAVPDEHRDLIIDLLQEPLPVAPEQATEYATELIERLEQSETLRTTKAMQQSLRQAETAQEKEHALRRIAEIAG